MYSIRRRLPWRTLILALLLPVCVVAAAPTTGSLADADAALTPATARPNIVLFMIDDGTVEDMKYLPKTRRLLGRAGMTFTNAINPNPLCCPARGQLLTGQVDHNNGILSNTGPYGAYQSLRDPDNTVGRWMRDAGYQTAFFGKYLNKFTVAVRKGTAPSRPPGWDVWDAFTAGTYDYTNFATATECGATQRKCIKAHVAKRRYTTTVQKRHTLAAIEKFSASDKPFFILGSWIAPHKEEDGGPPIPQKRWADLYRGTRNYAEAKPSFNERDFSDKKPIMKWQQEPGFRHRTQRMFLGRVRALKSVDNAVARTVKKLKALGEFDNTIFMFTSDNGFMNGEHRLTYKKWAFTEALRIPLVVTGPGFRPGTRTNRWVTMVDITATVLDAARAPSQRTSADGASFLHTDPTKRYRPRPILIGSGREKARSLDVHEWSYRGIMWGRYIWTRHWNKRGGVRGEQFYDLRTDRYQERSRPRAGNTRHVRRKMKAIYRDLRNCAGAECVAAPRKPPAPR